MDREIWITGVGMVSSAGVGVAAHLEALKNGDAPRVDNDSFTPYRVHPVVAVPFEQQIPKKADQRQMEAWQKLGVFAAGMALDAAGLKGDAERLGRLEMIVAAGGGERDYAVDGQILTQAPLSGHPAEMLNERLMSDIRPTMFLAQLSNLLAGNISIVHGVTGGSRTFMGEEQAGVDALRIAEARIRAGQADAFLVGGSYNAERPDVLLIYAMADYLWARDYAPVMERDAHGGGFILGSGAAFLVVEAADVARARGAKPLARLDAVASDMPARKSGSVAASLDSMWDRIATGFNPSRGVVFSGASGAAGVTTEEQSVLAQRAGEAAVHITGDLFGHMVEPQFPAGVALAAAALSEGWYDDAVVTGVGHRRGEGTARLSRVD